MSDTALILSAGFALLLVIGVPFAIALLLTAATVLLVADIEPVLLAQTMDVSGRLPMTALFRYLRKLKRRGEDVEDPQLDLTATYLATTVICAGVANHGGAGFYVGAVLVLGLALHRVRQPHHSLLAWLPAVQGRRALV